MFGDCLAVALMHKLRFSKEKFKMWHPGGNIGQTLLLVKDIMLVGKKLPTISINKTVGDAIKIINAKNLGLVVITKNSFIKGILTDGDARRSMKNYSKDLKIEKFMTKKPLIINENETASRALSIMNEKKITSLLVSSEKNVKLNKEVKLKGILHIHSLLKHGIK